MSAVQFGSVHFRIQMRLDEMIWDKRCKRGFSATWTLLKRSY